MQFESAKCKVLQEKVGNKCFSKKKKKNFSNEIDMRVKKGSNKRSNVFREQIF